MKRGDISCQVHRLYETASIKFCEGFADGVKAPSLSEQNHFTGIGSAHNRDKRETSTRLKLLTDP